MFLRVFKDSELSSKPTEIAKHIFSGRAKAVEGWRAKDSWVRRSGKEATPTLHLYGRGARHVGEGPWGCLGLERPAERERGRKGDLHGRARPP